MLTKFVTAAVAAGAVLFCAEDASAKKPGHCPPGHAKKGWCVPGPSFGGGHCPPGHAKKGWCGPGRGFGGPSPYYGRYDGRWPY